jgi:hypothetical protein
MKTLSITVLAMAVAFAVGTASSQPATLPQGSSAALATCCMDSKAQMGQMEQHMQRMQALHDKMANASPEERQKLMAEQRQQMQHGAMMGGTAMSGGMMAGAGMGGPSTGGGAKGAVKDQKAKPMDQKTQMQMMEKRMDMMQTMMQSMMDQQSGMGMGAIPGPSK